MRADQVLGKSRDRVKDLRASGSDVADLPQALAARANTLRRRTRPNFGRALREFFGICTRSCAKRC